MNDSMVRILMMIDLLCKSAYTYIKTRRRIVHIWSPKTPNLKTGGAGV